MQEQNSIRVKSLRKRFLRRSGGGEVIPVDDVSFEVADKEMLVLLGPSGCGKTTLLRCIAGLERPDEGEISINGQVVFSSDRGIFVPPNRRPVSMVFQTYALWPHMTVYQNVAYPLECRGVPSKEIGTRVGDILETVGLAGLRNQYPNQISGGQQQRVALSRAVASRTGVILFDEPLSNVDAKVREQLREEIVRMQRIFGFSGLYVTHDQVEAMAIASRIALLKQGKIDQLGTPEDLYKRPQSVDVGTFIGAANLMPGTVIDAKGNQLTLKTKLGSLSVENASGAPSANGEEVTILIRPESISISDERPPSGANSFECSMELSAFLGAYTEYTVLVGGHKLRVTSSDTAKRVTVPNPWIAVKPAEVVILRGKQA